MKRPVSAIRKSRGFEAAAQAPLDRTEQQDRTEALEPHGKTPAAPDKVTQLLGSDHFVTEYTWSWLAVDGPRGQHHQLFVSRWYPRQKVALDLFAREEPAAAEVAMKKQRLEAHGFKYFALTPSNSLADLTKYLGA